MFTSSGIIVLLFLLSRSYSQPCVGNTVSITSVSGARLQDTVSVSLGETITIRCLINPLATASYEWFRNGDQLSDTTEVIRHLNIQGVDGGNYTCRANLTTCFTQESKGFTIQTPPDLTVSEPSSFTIQVREGSPFSLRCAVSGWPFPRVQWRREGGAVVANNGDYVNPAASFSDAGAYFCEASNAVGSMTQTRVVQILRQIQQPTEMDRTESYSVNLLRELNGTQDQTGFYIGVGVTAGVSVGVSLFVVTMCIVSVIIACRPPPAATNPYEDWPDGQQDGQPKGEMDPQTQEIAPLQEIMVNPNTIEVPPSVPPQANEEDEETAPNLMPTKSEIGETI